LKPDNVAYLILPTTFVIGPTRWRTASREPVWEYILDPLIAALSFPTSRRRTWSGIHTPILFKRITGAATRMPCSPHMPRSLNGHRLIVGPGSVGQPRD
jgi:hypothetical protein